MFAPGSTSKASMTKLAVLDFETTGLDPEHDEAIELCVQIWTTEQGLLTDAEHTFYRLWMPQGEAHPKAAQVNGFTRDVWAARGAQPLCTQDMYELNKFIAGHSPDMYCGHNAAKFDVPFLHSTHKRTRTVPHTWKGDHRIIDTQSIAAILLFTGEIKGVGLEGLASHFGVINPAPHTAPGDVFTCVGVLEALASRYLRP